MSAVRAGRVVKNRGRRPNKSVLRMMAIMTDGNKEELPKEFVEGGRTGRRNAMPDILHSDANVTTADLPERLQQLATSVVQSASSPTSAADSNSSFESDDVLVKFLESDCSGHRNAKVNIPRISRDQATAVTSPVFASSISEAQLKEFLDSGCCHRRDGIPCITPPPKCVKKQATVGTTVSELSWKHCCSRECLEVFLKSTCAKRRSAVPCVRFPQGEGKSESTSVQSSYLRGEDKVIEFQYVPHVEMEVPACATQVIQLDEWKLREMLNDPNNPQPGPSSGPPPAEDNKDEERKMGS